MKYAKRMSDIKASEIRELLKLTEQPEVISFAGGLPAPELFPIDEIIEVSRIVLEENGEKALHSTRPCALIFNQYQLSRMTANLRWEIERPPKERTCPPPKEVGFKRRLYITIWAL